MHTLEDIDDIDSSDVEMLPVTPQEANPGSSIMTMITIASLVASLVNAVSIMKQLASKMISSSRTIYRATFGSINSTTGDRSNNLPFLRASSVRHDSCSCSYLAAAAAAATAAAATVMAAESARSLKLSG